jgi:translation initiation factor 2 subunit 1
MIRKKTGLPEESELVLCTVTKIYPHSVFVSIDDYENKEGMIHISEISPGRIRNIHDYVTVGKKIVCKVLQINRERGHIDLSFRRVSESQKRDKADQIKRQAKAEKIVEFVADKLKTDKFKLYNDITSKVTGDYSCLHDVFEEFITDESAIKRMNLPKEVYDILSETIRQRIKPPEVNIEGEVKLRSYSYDGVGTIRKMLLDGAKLNEKVSIKYKGGGTYTLNVIHEDYKDAEKLMKQAVDSIETAAKKNDCESSFERVDKKQAKKASS